MSLLNKVTESIAETKMGILSEWALRLCLSWVMFEYGQPKFNKLLEFDHCFGVITFHVPELETDEA